MTDAMAPDLQIERRLDWYIKLPVLVVLLAFTGVMILCAIWAWKSDSILWGLITTTLAGLLLVALVAYVVRYVIRGVRGHYLRIQQGALQMGEFGGRIVADIPVARIRRVVFNEAQGMNTRVETDDARTILNRLDLTEEEFDAVAAQLVADNPGIVIERL